MAELYEVSDFFGLLDQVVCFGGDWKPQCDFWSLPLVTLSTLRSVVFDMCHSRCSVVYIVVCFTTVFTLSADMVTI